MNYDKLGARPKVKQQLTLLKSDPPVLQSAAGKKSHQNMVIDNSCDEPKRGYVKQLSVWFDDQIENRATPVATMESMNRMKNKHSDEKSDEKVTMIEPQSDDLEMMPERHLQLAKVNLTNVVDIVHEDDQNITTRSQNALSKPPKWSELDATLKLKTTKGDKIPEDYISMKGGGGKDFNPPEDPP